MKIKKTWKTDGQEEIITLAEARKVIGRSYDDVDKVIEALKRGEIVNLLGSYLTPVN